MNTYIQDKLDEFDEKVNNTYEFFNATDGGGDLQYTINEIDIDGVRDFIQKALTDYYNHIIENIDRLNKNSEKFAPFQKIHYQSALTDLKSLLQDTNPKE